MFTARYGLSPYITLMSRPLQVKTHTHTHTHTQDKSSLDEGWARRKYSYLKTHSPHNGLIFTLRGGIQTYNPSKQEAKELQLRPCGHWDRPIIYIICIILMIKSRKMRWMEDERLKYVDLPQSKLSARTTSMCKEL